MGMEWDGAKEESWRESEARNEAGSGRGGEVIEGEGWQNGEGGGEEHRTSVMQLRERERQRERERGTEKAQVAQKVCLSDRVALWNAAPPPPPTNDAFDAIEVIDHLWLGGERHSLTDGHASRLVLLTTSTSTSTKQRSNKPSMSEPTFTASPLGGHGHPVHSSSASSSSKSVHSTVSAAHSLPSPPDSPKLEAEDGERAGVGGRGRPATDDTNGDADADAIEMRPLPSVGLSERSDILTTMAGDMNEVGHSTEYDPLLLRTRLVGDEEIELRRRATAKKGRGRAKMVGE